MEPPVEVGFGSNTSHSLSVSPPAMSIEKLFPALLECFGIVLCGYVAGRADIITSTQAKGLGNFVSKFALPALLYKNMVLLDFGNVMWSFLWSILIAKVSVFVIVCALTLVVTGPENRFGKAGLFSIFATQSNDFALGYPIVEALYKNTHPEYLQYIYLVAPISLMILNPIGFAFCEVQNWRTSQEQHQHKLRIVAVVILQVLKNPIVFMVIVGLASHFLLGQKIPTIMQEFVDGLANSFGGAALFYLGLSMVGQLGKFTRSTVVALILLITAKLLVMPLICRDMVELLDTDNDSSHNHSSLSNYAFLYGVFPSAPSVAIYAAQYNMELEVVTSGMVISTFLSAPIMYVSAWLLTIPWMDPKPLVSALQNVSFNISIISLVALVWTIAVMLLSKKFKRFPHVFTMNLFLAQFLVCIGMILWNFIVKQDNFIGQVLTFTLLYGSLYSTYIWAALIALALFLMKKDNELKVPVWIFPIVGWGVPALIVGVLLIAGERMPDTIDSAFFYGRSQIISTAVVQFCGILLGGGSLMGLSRGPQDPNYHVLEQDCSSGATDDAAADHCPENQAPQEAGPTEGSITRDQCDAVQCEPATCLLAQEEVRLQQQCDPQAARHVLLCLLLVVSLLANLSSCLWWLFNRVPGRLYLELQFFCAIANYGQGFISFGIFGLDKHLIILPFKKRLSCLWPGRGRAEDVQAPVTEEVRLTCLQFVRYHKDQCAQDIVQKRRCGERTMVATFLGSDLVEWLLRAGVARDRGEGLRYGSQLQQGGVLQAVTPEVGFLDGARHYRFTEDCRLERQGATRDACIETWD
uniref:G protein-coupled receptor 155 n=1 Tax=Paramormyrops kingsleyae TaxID=1676925 RepID=A0A3B3QNW2_9TELE